MLHVHVFPRQSLCGVLPLSHVSPYSPTALGLRGSWSIKKID
ncbi:unnamed protein product [Acanthoscelides obtectus]|uniref:Uncharacterized protein n=1 Tax=Acanthoscelides obtectus TaxID=200917 RepID=A0A9P0JNZ3_ACAOB|nr:unnamed protein product [Acanthoscelides obtectus]CAK1673847.1 hypothetical protein AOBTE_LOCUS29459 [Acanthoscelides obtectus]